MRKNLLHIGHKELSYEIRKIVEIATKIESFGVEIFWENIGDPVEKGETIPTWMKKLVSDACMNDFVYGYSPTKGLLKTREYIASKYDNLELDNIIFFNGLGEAISKIYKNLSFDSRVIGPNPAYSTHSSAEAAHAGTSHITYSLQADNNWIPDIEELENKVKYNPNIVSILVINPDNPTGAVFSKTILLKIVEIAKKYELFLIFDEIYEKLTYNEKNKVLLADIIGEIPGISLKGISKDIPWPGARCGWMEIYNKDKDENFSKYIDSIIASKMLEVCSTTLPQYLIPEIYENINYKESLVNRIKKYQARAKIAKDILGDIKIINLVEPKGAFYLSITFNMDKLNKSLIPEIIDNQLSNYVKSILINNTRFDKKFCYYLLAIEGVCSVPLSGFNSTYEGFRITLLENDIDKFKLILNKIKNTILLFK